MKLTKAQQGKLDKGVADLNDLLDEVRKTHPHANWFLAMEGLHLMSESESDQDYSLGYANLWRSGGGDW